MCLLTRFLN